MDSLRDMLIPRFLEISPLRVYALASRWGFEEEAKIASTRTLQIDIFNELSGEDAELMGGAACLQLSRLHSNRREAARALITSHRLPSPTPFSTGHGHCRCDVQNYSRLTQALSQHVARTPWVTVGELYEVAIWGPPKKCSVTCRNVFENMHRYFASLLKGISELPRTI